MAAAKKSFKGFDDAERAAMKERALELQAEEKMNKSRAAGEEALMAKVAEMPESDKVMALKIHEIVTTYAPSLMPKTWYGMPAYANKETKVVCFFQGAEKFEARYAVLGFSDRAMLDDGDIWPTSYALKKIGPAEEAKIIELIKKAVA